MAPDLGCDNGFMLSAWGMEMHPRIVPNGLRKLCTQPLQAVLAQKRHTQRAHAARGTVAHRFHDLRSVLKVGWSVSRS